MIFLILVLYFLFVKCIFSVKMSGFEQVFEGLKVIELVSVLVGLVVGMFFVELGV